MARQLWSLVCRRALIDENFKSASLIDVLEGIDVRPPPGESLQVVPMDLAFVTLWTRSDKSKPEVSTQRVRIVAPNGSESAQTLAKVDLSGHRNWRNIVHFHGFAFHGPGDYTFVVDLGAEHKWVEHSRVVMEVNLNADKG